MRHPVHSCILLASLLFCLIQPGYSATPTTLSSPLPAQPAGAPVTFAETTLFELYDHLGPFTPQDRARAVSERLTHLAKAPFTRIDTITTVDRDTASELVYGDMVVMTVTDRDAQPTGKSRQDLAKEYAQATQAALTRSREQVTEHAFIVNIAWAVADTIILILVLILFHKTFPKVYAKIESWRGTFIQSIRIQRVELLSAGQIAATLTALIQAIRVAAVLALLYVYLTTVLGIFPWTRSISAALFGAVLRTFGTIGDAFATYIPNVVSIIIIAIVTRYIIKLIRLLFTGIERGAITFAEFHREWAQPTYKIVRFLVIVFAAIAIFPYIPGSQSEGFRGISVFLGLLLSLGSAVSISNIIAGVVLTYMHPFRLGDRVKVADTIGDVIETGLLVTRIRTIKNVDVTIPNSLVLGNHLINFSSSATQLGLILHTSISIGYDVPWKKIHELLIAAARATTHILPEPAPFVFQTSLDDFYVTYEINAYTAQPNLMASIYAELHQHIQDRFNEAGIEIMSPHFTQVRDGNKLAIPDAYLPREYHVPGLRIWPVSPDSLPSGKGEGGGRQ